MGSFSDLFEKKGRIKGKLIGLKFLSSLLFPKRIAEQMEFSFLPVAGRSNEPPTSPLPQHTKSFSASVSASPAPAVVNLH